MATQDSEPRNSCIGPAATACPLHLHDPMPTTFIDATKKNHHLLSRGLSKSTDDFLAMADSLPTNIDTNGLAAFSNNKGGTCRQCPAPRPYIHKSLSRCQVQRFQTGGVHVRCGNIEIEVLHPDGSVHESLSPVLLGDEGRPGAHSHGPSHLLTGVNQQVINVMYYGCKKLYDPMLLLLADL